MIPDKIKIATRRSPLALWQARHVAQLLERTFPQLEAELVTMVTKGDKMLDAPLAKVGGKGLFVKELEQGMLDGKADIAVHSMKDVPVEFPPGLHLAAILAREDPRDALVAERYQSLADLPPRPRIGTCSLRRQCQLKALLPDAQILDLRGNVNTRLERLAAGSFDAIVLASAGLKRLELSDRITEFLEPSVCLPAIGQGAIGIECRVDDEATNACLQALSHENTRIRVSAERAMNERLNGGCQVPIAGYAEIEGDRLVMRGLVGKPDGTILLRSESSAGLQEAVPLGQAVAEDLLAQGADKILRQVYG